MLYLTYNKDVYKIMENILKENILYLKEWSKINPSFNDLSIEGKDLILKINDTQEKQDISEFYFPEMLYNETFRQKLAKDYTAENLFRIIQVYCQAKEVLNEEPKDPTIIKSVEIKNEDKKFILFTTLDQKKYRFDTENPEKILNLFLITKEKKPDITLKEFGEVLKNDSTKSI